MDSRWKQEQKKREQYDFVDLLAIIGSRDGLIVDRFRNEALGCFFEPNETLTGIAFLSRLVAITFLMVGAIKLTCFSPVTWGRRETRAALSNHVADSLSKWWQQNPRWSVNDSRAGQQSQIKGALRRLLSGLGLAISVCFLFTAPFEWQVTKRVVRFRIPLALIGSSAIGLWKLNGLISFWLVSSS